ncbi:GNAT family N-acetyltransferase [Rossellomorea aquimaris]|uniref:GNAT family N-acetyltransferase n=1 Tax=Rossellomorea aquimaris TaxID=189382 RepID=UPI001CD21FE4|nr:GNAT family N-acetyltransferase [Rossellomorea aquimaris]MCA1054017.1 GNAT family N-acetyltransferase [Rossellomorea aquimaris]
MKIEIKKVSERQIRAHELMRLYRDAGWWPERDSTDIEKLLIEGCAVGAWYNDELVGFARAVTDGIFRAYIEDVVVDHRFQNSGIGKELVALLLEDLSHIDVISLFCEEDLIPFYEKNHFKASKSQFVMHRKVK